MASLYHAKRKGVKITGPDKRYYAELVGQTYVTPCCGATLPKDYFVVACHIPERVSGHTVALTVDGYRVRAFVGNTTQYLTDSVWTSESR